MRRPISFVSSVLALSFLAGTAHAHHYIPYAMDIQFQPNDPQHVVVAGLDFGLFSSQDGGQTWQLGCYEALEDNSSAARLSSSLIVTTTGAVLNQNGFSTVRAAAELCSSEPALTGGASSPPLGAGLRRAEDGTLFGLTSTGTEDGIVTELWRSDADGASFAPVGKPLRGQFAARSFALSRNPLRIAGAPPVIYAGGMNVGDDAGAFAIARTSDLGETWEIGEWSIPEIADGDQLDLIGASPWNSFLLFARESTASSAVPFSDPDTIWFSNDAGGTWQVLYRGEGRVQGFAFSPDGGTLAIGDSRAGLFHVDVTSLGKGDAPDVQRVFDQPVFAITWNASGLYAGLNEYQARDLPQFVTVGVSQDGGRTFAPFMSVCHTQVASCDPSSEAHQCFGEFMALHADSGRCDGVGGGGNGSGSTTGGGGASSSGGAPSSGGASSSGGDSSGGESSGGDSSGGAAASDDDLRVTSCAMSSPHENSRSSHIAFFMLTAAGALLFSRRR